MPNRIIKESAFISDKIASLSDFAFRLWVGLITSADDAGRGDARPAIIKGRVFPLQEQVSIKAVEEAICVLAAKGCISLYTVSGKPYFCFPTWADHQRVRDCRTKYPGPEEDDSPRQTAAVCGEVPPESESESESISESISETETETESVSYPKNSSRPRRGDTAAADKEKTHRTYDHDSYPYMAAAFLDLHMRQNIPRLKPATEKQLQDWADSFRLLNERDGYDWDTVADVLGWCVEDSFWQKNILSGGAFRRQFPKLLAKTGTGYV